MQLDPVQRMKCKQDLCCIARSLKAPGFFHQGERSSGNVAEGIQKKGEVHRGKTKVQLAKLSKIQLRFTSLVLGCCESSVSSRPLSPKFSFRFPSESKVQVDVQQPSPFIIVSILQGQYQRSRPSSYARYEQVAK